MSGFAPRCFCILACAGVLLAAVSAQAGTIRADRSDSQYTTLANQAVFASVGKFAWTESSGSYLASGTLINGQWVLTAAHVVSGINSGNIGTMTFTLGGHTYHVSQTYYDSSWDGNPSSGYDIGLVKLSSVVTSVAPSTLYTNTDESRQIATVVGYGQSGTGLTGEYLAAGTKRAGTNVIGLGSALNGVSWTGGGNDTMLAADFDPPGPTGDPTTDLSVPTDLEYCAGSGDSGGGWFIQKNGQQYLAGVTSFLARNPANSSPGMYDDIFGATRVSSYLAWISQYTSYYGTTYKLGDADGNFKIDGVDLAALSQNWDPLGSKSDTWAKGDFNGDGKIDGIDLAELAQNWGPLGYSGEQMVPEPTILAMLTLGALAALRRRR